MKILANSCLRCGAATNAVRDNTGRFVEVDPKEVEFLAYAGNTGTARLRGYVVHRSVCQKPKPAADPKAEKPKRASKRGLGKRGVGEAATVAGTEEVRVEGGERA